MIRQILALVGLSVSLSAYAALIDHGSYTTDTRTGLDWLDVSLTAGMSFSEVSADLTEGGAFEGWSYATGAQLSSFFDSAGGSGSYNGFDPAHGDVAPLLNQLWGSTHISPSAHSIFAITATTFPTAPGQNWVAVVADNLTSTEYDRIQLYYRAFYPYQSGPDFGSALYRVSNVPLPASAYMFATALFMLAGRRFYNS